VSLPISATNLLCAENVLAVTNNTVAFIFIVKKKEHTLVAKWHQTVLFQSSPLCMNIMNTHLLIGEMSGVYLWILRNTRKQVRDKDKISGKKQVGESQLKKQDNYFFVDTEEAITSLSAVNSS